MSNPEFGGQPDKMERGSRKVMVSLSRTDSQDLDHLREISGIQKDAPVLRELIGPGVWVADEIIEGGKIVSIRPDGTQNPLPTNTSDVLKGVENSRKEAEGRKKATTNVPLERLGLSSYATNRLTSRGIKTVADLLEAPDRRLRFIGMGKVSLQQIEEALKPYRQA